MTAAGDAPASGSRSLVKILSNIFISFIGAGILGLPYAFKESGLLEGVVIMVSVGTISTKAMLLIIDCKYHILNTTAYHRLSQVEPAEDVVPKAKFDSELLSYGDVGHAALGRIGRSLVEIAIVISQIGFSCAYLIFIVHNLGSYLPAVRDWHFLACLLPFIFILTLYRRLGSLGYFSLFAQLSNLFAFVVVLWFDFAHLAHANINPREFNVQGLPFFAAVAIYCYEGAGMILSLEGSVHESRRMFFKKYFIITMVVVTTMYTSFGICGYLSFGEHTRDIITLNLPRGSSLDFALIVKICLCLALFFTYPVMMFPVTQILEALFGWTNAFWRGNLLRLALVLISGGIVLLIPNFGNLMALIGSGCCTLLAFVLPGVFHLILVGKSQGVLGRGFDVLLVMVGLLGMLVGLWDAFSRMESDVALRLMTKGLNATLPPSSPVKNLSPELHRTTDTFMDRPTPPFPT